MPYAIEKARTSRTLALTGLFLLYASCLPIAWILFLELRQPHSRFDTLGAALAAAMMSCIIIGVHVSLRGTWGDGGAAPLAQLAVVERRQRGRLRLLRLFPWLVGCFVAGVVALFVAQSIDQGHVVTSEVIWLIVLAATSIPPSWIGLSSLRKRVVRELAEIEEARRLLHEDE